MANPIIVIHDLETNEIIEREMTKQEFESYNKTKKSVEAEVIQAEAKASQRQAIADRLGLTADELKLLLG